MSNFVKILTFRLSGHHFQFLCQIVGFLVKICLKNYLNDHKNVTSWLSFDFRSSSIRFDVSKAALNCYESNLPPIAGTVPTGLIPRADRAARASAWWSFFTLIQEVHEQDKQTIGKGNRPWHIHQTCSKEKIKVLDRCCSVVPITNFDG